jgi:hypothetical protein
MWQMYSVGLDAVLMTAMHADTTPKKSATAMQAIVAMYSSLIRKVRSWYKMSIRSMWNVRSPNPWFSLGAKTSGANVMIAIFGECCQFSSNSGVFLKTN